MSLEFLLFQALQFVSSLELPPGVSSSGKQFEDFMVKQLYAQLSQSQDDYRVFPPRHTLLNATFSGVHHQFDLVIAQQEDLTTVECKFRGSAHIDQLFATQGKLMDYLKRPNGIFITTAPHVNDDMYYYAIAHQIQVFCPSLPPIEYMLQCVIKGTDLENRLNILKSRMKNNIEPRHVLVEWRNAYNRFQSDGYQQ